MAHIKYYGLLSLYFSLSLYLSVVFVSGAAALHCPPQQPLRTDRVGSVAIQTDIDDVTKSSRVQKVVPSSSICEDS